VVSEVAARRFRWAGKPLHHSACITQGQPTEAAVAARRRLPLAMPLLWLLLAIPLLWLRRLDGRLGAAGRVRHWRGVTPTMSGLAMITYLAGRDARSDTPSFMILACHQPDVAARFRHRSSRSLRDVAVSTSTAILAIAAFRALAAAVVVQKAAVRARRAGSAHYHRRRGR
jgi:hypothetical protein